MKQWNASENTPHSPVIPLQLLSLSPPPPHLVLNLSGFFLWWQFPCPTPVTMVTPPPPHTHPLNLPTTTPHSNTPTFFCTWKDSTIRVHCLQLINHRLLTSTYIILCMNPVDRDVFTCQATPCRLLEILNLHLETLLLKRLERLCSISILYTITQPRHLSLGQQHTSLTHTHQDSITQGSSGGSLGSSGGS
jgi:hypothetical protein